jgi:hypothetical protein
MVDDADEEPALGGDGRPPVGIPSELMNVRVLSAVVLDRDAMMLVSHVEAGDEHATGIAESPIEFGFGETGAHENPSHLRLAWRLRTGTNGCQRRGEVDGSSAPEARAGIAQVVAVGESVGEDVIAYRDKVVL